MTTTAAPTDARTGALAVADRLSSGYARQDAVGMGHLYAEDATWELHVGEAHVLLHGRPAIVERYAGDLHLPPTLHRWDVRPTPWGAVVEADAEQGDEGARVRFRWVHLLTIERDRIVADVVYCTGAVPVPAPA